MTNDSKSAKNTSLSERPRKMLCSGTTANWKWVGGVGGWGRGVVQEVCRWVEWGCGLIGEGEKEEEKGERVCGRKKGREGDIF